GFGFIPEGGDVPVYCNSDGTCFNSSFFFNSLRPQKQGRVDGSQFFTTGSLNHELKFGASYRKADVTSVSNLGGAGAIANDAYTQVADGSASTGIFVASRASGVGYSAKNTAAFVQDTMTSGAFTFNVGLHYDKQKGSTTAVSIPANPYVPSVLPG